MTMSIENKVVFHTSGLTKVYDMGEVQVHALRGIDLDLYENELVALLGASGSGKSTLVNILGGLDTATEGSVIYRGKDLTKASEKELTEYRRHYVGFVFQFYNLIPSLTALENVAIVTEIARNPMKPIEALDMVGLKDRAQSLSVTALRRRTTAGGYCKSHCETPRGFVMR
jgi:putative ABC transport system ATP-binding protein